MKRVAVFLCVFFTILIAQTWESYSHPSINDDRILHATVYDPDSDMIYMIGGSPNNIWTNMNNYVYRYDPGTDTWNTSLSNMPTARAFIQGAYWDGKIYVIGGMNSTYVILNLNQVYDIATDSWSSLAPIPQARAAHGTVAHDGNIYVIGGSNLMATGFTSVSRYNTASGTWSQATSLPQAWEMGGCAIWDNVIYLCGGYDRNAMSTYGHIWSGTIDPGNPDNITWAQREPLPFLTGYSGATAMDGNVYILGGFDESFRLGTRQFLVYQISILALMELALYPIAITRNHMVIARRGYNQVYGVAGDADGNYVEPNNYYYKIDDPMGINETKSVKVIADNALAIYPSIGQGQFTISFSLPNAGQVTLDVYNALGDKISTLYNGTAEEGTTVVRFSADDLSNGIYFVRVCNNGSQVTKKFVISQ
ncbi:MAG: T9SS type A sorting domain-containing protein [candidate division WOR-3 bacterium]|nr:MAG: T9SS type A sorting domain-containing protein [candidate division WOR-3 bacterium]